MNNMKHSQKKLDLKQELLMSSILEALYREEIINLETYQKAQEEVNKYSKNKNDDPDT